MGRAIYFLNPSYRVMGRARARLRNGPGSTRGFWPQPDLGLGLALISRARNPSGPGPSKPDSARSGLQPNSAGFRAGSDPNT